MLKLERAAASHGVIRRAATLKCMASPCPRLHPHAALTPPLHTPCSSSTALCTRPHSGAWWPPVQESSAHDQEGHRPLPPGRRPTRAASQRAPPRLRDRRHVVPTPSQATARCDVRPGGRPKPGVVRGGGDQRPQGRVRLGSTRLQIVHLHRRRRWRQQMHSRRQRHHQPSCGQEVCQLQP